MALALVRKGELSMLRQQHCRDGVWTCLYQAVQRPQLLVQHSSSQGKGFKPKAVHL